MTILQCPHKLMINIPLIEDICIIQIANNLYSTHLNKPQQAFLCLSIPLCIPSELAEDVCYSTTPTQYVIVLYLYCETTESHSIESGLYL